MFTECLSDSEMLTEEGVFIPFLFGRMTWGVKTREKKMRKQGCKPEPRNWWTEKEKGEKGLL